ncbi:MAG TPA: hypothetical protein VF379_08840, partial [Gaiellaceae bacterium]
GCTVQTGGLKCFLDFLSGQAPVGHIQIVTKVTATGAQTLTATATCQQGVSSATDATTSLAFNSTAPTTATATGAPGGLNDNGGTTTKKPDKKAPTSRAVNSAGVRGSTAKLRFKIYDDRGVAKALTTVKHNGRLVGTASTGFGPVAYGSTYYVGWHVPATAAKGTYTFCVVAVDHAGNHSHASCAALAVK